MAFPTFARRRTPGLFREGSSRRGAVAAALALLIGGATAGHATEDASPAKGPADLSVIRFEFDNDLYLGSDNGFTAGWSLQYHTAPRPELVSWVRRLPGFAGSDPTVRWSYGLSQIMVTPDDLAVEELQPDDAPYAGTLGVHATLAAFDNRKLAAAQLYVGCMGPCSGAEHVQKFVHDNFSGEDPNGWDNQLDNAFLGNLNLEGRWKLLASPASSYAPKRWASDLAFGGQVGLGNLATFAEAQVEFRFGRGLPMGSTHVPDPPGIGTALDPVHLPDFEAAESTADKSFRGYASLVLRAAEYDELAPADGGRTRNGLWHPGVETAAGNPQLIAGLHAARLPVTVHVTYFRYLDRPEGVDDRQSLDWINLSFEWRF